MFVRKTTFTGLEDVDAAVAFLRDTAIAERRHQRGARGLMASGNRLDGELEVMGYWDTDADLEASIEIKPDFPKDPPKYFHIYTRVDH